MQNRCHSPYIIVVLDFRIKTVSTCNKANVQTQTISDLTVTKAMETFEDSFGKNDVDIAAPNLSRSKRRRLQRKQAKKRNEADRYKTCSEEIDPYEASFDYTTGSQDTDDGGVRVPSEVSICETPMSKSDEKEEQEDFNILPAADKEETRSNSHVCYQSFRSFLIYKSI